MLTETKKAYVAGFLDGEGSIQISEDSKSKYRKNRSRVSFIIAIDNTNLKTLKTIGSWLKEVGIHFKIGTYERKKEKHRKIRHRLNLWRLSDCYEFLSFIYPFLILKKPQAKLALKYLKGRIDKLEIGPRAKILTVQERRMIQKLHKLNKRGRL